MTTRIFALTGAGAVKTLRGLSAMGTSAVPPGFRLGKQFLRRSGRGRVLLAGVLVAGALRGEVQGKGVFEDACFGSGGLQPAQGPIQVGRIFCWLQGEGSDEGGFAFRERRVEKGKVWFSKRSDAPAMGVPSQSCPASTTPPAGVIVAVR